MLCPVSANYLVWVSDKKNLLSLQLGSMIYRKTSIISNTRVCLAPDFFMYFFFLAISSGVCSYSRRSRQVKREDIPSCLKSFTPEISLTLPAVADCFISSGSISYCWAKLASGLALELAQWTLGSKTSPLGVICYYISGRAPSYRSESYLFPNVY